MPLDFDYGWNKVEDSPPPHGDLCLVVVEDFNNENGRYARLRALYVGHKEKHMVLAEGCEGGWYDEDEDEYYVNEGWYEVNEFEETHWLVVGNVVAWQHLPAYPHWAGPPVPF